MHQEVQADALFYQFKDHRDMFSLLTINKLVVALLILLTISACTTMPAQEMSDARQALQAADQVNAEEKAPAAYEEAKRLLDQAQSEISRHNYYEAKRLADAAKKAALRAHELSVGQ